MLLYVDEEMHEEMCCPSRFKWKDDGKSYQCSLKRKHDGFFIYSCKAVLPQSTPKRTETNP